MGTGLSTHLLAPQLLIVILGWLAAIIGEAENYWDWLEVTDTMHLNLKYSFDQHCQNTISSKKFKWLYL